MWVRLNVGGQLMETSVATVTKYPDSNLAKMFMVEQDLEDDVMMVSHGDNNNIYNIDCDPDSFGIILTWLRYEYKFFRFESFQCPLYFQT